MVTDKRETSTVTLEVKVERAAVRRQLHAHHRASQ
jgi:hypothetical protein